MKCLKIQNKKMRLIIFYTEKIYYPKEKYSTHKSKNDTS